MHNNPANMNVLHKMIECRSLERTWTVEDAVNILATIEHNKRFPAEALDVRVSQKLQEQSAIFIKSAIENGRLLQSDDTTKRWVL